MRNTNIDMKTRARVIRKTLALILSFAVVIGMSMSPATGWSVWANTNAESIIENGAEGSADETASEDPDAIDQSAGQNDEPEGEDAAAETEEDVSDETNEADADEAADASPDNTAEDTSEAEGAEKTSAAEEDAEDDLGALDSILVTAAAVDTGDFSVEGPESSYTFSDGVLTITGDVTVSMKEDGSSTSQRIVIADDAAVTIKDISIAAEGAPAIFIQAPANAVLTLEGKNTVLGGNGKNVNHISGSYAGIEVGWESHEKMASLTINGNGELDAKGGPNSAAIGGSKSSNGVYGNITIDSGTIVATSGETDDEWAGGAGIGSSDNPNNGTSSGSYKHTEDSWGTITINGGNITAIGGYNAAGIGGGNHTDSGKIIITGGTIDAKGHTGIGSGYGSSQTTSRTDLTKGPGYYFADIEISGGTITATAWSTGSTNDGGAGIGGGMYSDARITITGGTITATGGNGKGLSSYHHGGSGIGGGYEGHSEITITGGTIIANGGGAAAGIGSGSIPNQNMDNGGSQGYKCRAGETTCDYTDIKITGGEITATGGVSGGAGIGGGVGADKIKVAIEGGDITAIGGKGSEDKLKYKDNGSPYAGGNGGAGIGSGYSGTTSGESPKYFVTTDDLDIKITDGSVIAIGGWGASGIGSGADNTTATSITIDASKAAIEAYADGTKFAIDTRELSTDGKHTDSITSGRDITGDMLQGTFVHNYETPDVKQSPEGLKSIKITNDNTGDSKTLTLMPDGYRSFATDVADPGTFTVYTDEESIGKGEGRYFSKLTTDIYDEEEAADKNNTVQYEVQTGALSDNFYLFPVKSVLVEKIVDGKDSELKGLNTTVYFGICYKDEAGNVIFLKDGDKIWSKSIEIKNGKPQGKAYFVNLDDRTYDVREIKSADDTSSPEGTKFGTLTLNRITTQHGEAFSVDEGAEHGLAITKEASSEDGKIDITVKVSASHDDDYSLSLSIFADGKLASDSKKLDRSNDWTMVWTIDEKDASGSEIEYSFADTSNNATIDADHWSDEIKVINTFKGDEEPVSIRVTKSITDYFDANDGAENNTANATFIFKVRAYGADTSEALYENYISVTFDEYGDPQSEELEIKGVSGIETIKVTEVYGAGYQADEAEQTISLNGDDAAEKTEDGFYEFEFTNTYGDKIVEGSGVLNRYQDKSYVDPDAEQEPAA